MGQSADPGKQFKNFKTTADLQYCNPKGHRDLLSCIVRSHMPEMVKELEGALAVSLRMDGSIDRTQGDSEFVMAKIVKKDGSSKLIFVGHQRLAERGVEGKRKRKPVNVS